MKYFEELIKSMTWLGERDCSIFIGQACKYPGTSLYKTLQFVTQSKILEVPVFEDSQIGISIGLSLSGFIPINIMPRFNFTLLACNQIINHLDKYKKMSDNQYIPKVIIRTVIGSEKPLFPGYQHVGDFSDAFKLLCNNIEVIRLDEPEQILDSYKKAFNRQDGRSTLIVEWGDFYKDN